MSKSELPPPRSSRRRFLTSFAQSVKSSLESRLERQSFAFPTTPTLSTYLGVIQDGVHTAWEEEMMGRLTERDFSSLIGIQPTETIQEMVTEDKYDLLHRLRFKGEPLSWMAVVSALSQREQLTAQTAHTFIRGMEDKQVKELFGYSKQELLLFVDISKDLQKPIDQAYIKQMEVSKENPPEFRKTDGAEYFYISQNPGENTSYAPLVIKFPEEIHEISTVLETYAVRIEAEMKQAKLPQSYTHMPSYLRRMAQAFISQDTSLSATHSQWSALRSECARLSEEDGCPLVVNPINFTGEGGHIDIELLVGIKDTATTQLQENTKAMSHVVNPFAQEVGVPPEKMPLVPTVFFRSLIHSGSNLSMSSTANSMKEYIGFNLSGDHKESHYLFDKYSKKILSHPSTKSEYLSWRRLVTSAHELGHLLLINMGHSHLGEGLSQNKLEELKADTLGALYFSRSKERSEAECKKFLEIYLIDYIDEIQSYLTNKDSLSPDDSSHWYAFSGLTVLNHLFVSGALSLADNKISINEAKKGVEAMAQLGIDIAQLYAHEEVTPETVIKWVTEKEFGNMKNGNVDWYLLQVK